MPYKFKFLHQPICTAGYKVSVLSNGSITQLLIYLYLHRADVDFDNLQLADIGFERC
jgi:hypothetical protein